MITYKEVDVPATTRREMDEIFCDMCKEKLEEKQYKIDEATLEYRGGSSYSSSGQGYTLEFDICGKCFKTKLVDWMKVSFNAEARQVTWDY